MVGFWLAGLFFLFFLVGGRTCAGLGSVSGRHWRLSVSSSPHLSYCAQTLFFLIHLCSVFTVLQSHADLKPPRSALFWGQIEEVHKHREEKTDCFNLIAVYLHIEVIILIGLCYTNAPRCICHLKKNHCLDYFAIFYIPQILFLNYIYLMRKNPTLLSNGGPRRCLTRLWERQTEGQAFIRRSRPGDLQVLSSAMKSSSTGSPLFILACGGEPWMIQDGLLV